MGEDLEVRCSVTIETLREMARYAVDARRIQGLSDDEIAEDLERQWPGAIPGGIAVDTQGSVIWIHAAEYR